MKIFSTKQIIFRFFYDIVLTEKINFDFIGVITEDIFKTSKIFLEFCQKIILRIRINSRYCYKVIKLEFKESK